MKTRKFTKSLTIQGNMALRLDGNAEIGAHVCNVGNLICMRHLINSRAVTNWFSPKIGPLGCKPVDFTTCVLLLKEVLAV